MPDTPDPPALQQQLQEKFTQYLQTAMDMKVDEFNFGQWRESIRSLPQNFQHPMNGPWSQYDSNQTPMLAKHWNDMLRDKDSSRDFTIVNSAPADAVVPFLRPLGFAIGRLEQLPKDMRDKLAKEFQSI